MKVYIPREIVVENIISLQVTWNAKDISGHLAQGHSIII
jgi:hypothetical protein